MNQKIEMRKIVPVAAMISAGKSKLLNVLYGINFLECKAGIGTKFVNLLRYNPNITEPRFYHLRLRKEGDEYVFYKDNLSSEIIGEKNIIEENKNTNQFLSNDSDFNYENIFYMTEINESPFIKDKEYLLTHDLCDIPGLSEYQDNQNKTEQIPKEEEKEKEKELDAKAKIEEIRKKYLEEDEEKISEMKKMIIEDKKENSEFKNETKEENNKKDNENKEIKNEIIENNNLNDNGNKETKNEIIENSNVKTDEKKEVKNEKKEDDIFYNVKIEENTYLSEIFKIIKNYIDGAIIVLSIQNYYFDCNFQLIAKLHKVIEKELTNFLIILNKTDLSTNLNADINKCKGLFMKHFPSCKTFNINLNTFIPLSTIQLQNELNFDKSFKHLLNYHFYNYKEKINKEKLINKNVVSKSFIDHLKDIIKTEKSITREEIEKTVNGFNNPGINDEIIPIINELIENFKGKDINFGITEKDFIINKSDEDENNILDLDIDLMGDNTSSSSNNNIDEINPSYILKFLFIYQTQNKLIPSLSEETFNLLNYFRVKKKLLKLEDGNTKNIEAASEKTNINKRMIDNLKTISNQIKGSQFISNEITDIINEISKTIEFLKIYDVIFIPFLGPSSAGKTTIINGIIGEELLPADLNECTKRGIFIRYLDEKEKETNIRKAIFREEEFLGQKKYYFEADKIIAKGLKNVQDTVKGLNYEFSDKEEDSFYYIRTKIKLFDDMGLDDHYKKMIYLIDFPGYGTKNIFEEKLYKKVMSICNSFAFVVRNSVIKEDNNKELFESIFINTRNQKNKLSKGFIKNCLFVLNNDNSQTTTEKDINTAKQEINELIKVEQDDINILFFNAQYYNNYIDNYNYFYKISRTFNDEFKKYRDYKINLYKFPELYKEKTYKNFCSFFYKEVVEKIKKGFSKTIDKNQEIKDNVKAEINEIIKEFEISGYIQKNEFPENIKNTIGKIFSFAQKNVNDLSTLKESNIEKFKEIFLNQICFVNSSMQEKLKIKINDVIQILDYFFIEDFSQREKDLKVLNEFKTNVCDVVNKLDSLYNNSNKEIESIRKNYENSILQSLQNKKDHIKQLLEKETWEKIKDEIDIKMKENLGKFNQEIQNYLNGIDYNAFLLYEKGKKLFSDFTKSKILLKEFGRFKNYFLEQTSNKNENFTEEILKELKTSMEKTIQKIYDEKGFWAAISSSIWNDNYLMNIIEIIIKYYTNHTKYLFDLLKNNFESYINEIKHTINIRKNIILSKYTKRQSAKWKNLCTIYTDKRKNICDDLDTILNK